MRSTIPTTFHGRRDLALTIANRPVPRLSDMATQAVKFLQHKSAGDGYFVMIEAGRIDQAHHNGKATKALSETLAFDKAVEEVMKLVNTSDTLVIVTADHAHTLSIGGYTGRFHDITGAVEDPMGYEDDADDEESISILSYGKVKEDQRQSSL